MARPAREGRREAIIAGALAQIARNGFHATTMAQIAAATGMSTGTLYLYFSSKDALFDAIVESFYAFDEGALPADADLETTLRAWVAVRLERSRPFIPVLPFMSEFYAIGLRRAPLHACLAAGLERHVQFLGEAFARAGSAFARRNPERTARAFVALFEGEDLLALVGGAMTFASIEASYGFLLNLFLDSAGRQDTACS